MSARLPDHLVAGSRHSGLLTSAQRHRCAHSQKIRVSEGSSVSQQRADKHIKVTLVSPTAAGFSFCAGLVDAELN